MKIKKYNLSRARKYQVNGVEKTAWDNVGRMTEFFKDNGEVGRLIEIPAIGLEARAFEQLPKDTQNPNGTSKAEAVPAETPKEEPSPEVSALDRDFPF